MIIAISIWNLPVIIDKRKHYGKKRYRGNNKKDRRTRSFFVIVLFYFTKSNIIGTTFRLPFVGVK